MMSDKKINILKNHRSTKFIALIIISLLFLSMWIILFLPNATQSNIDMEVIGKNSQTVKPGEAVFYPIQVENKGEVPEDIRFETIGTPEGWQSVLNMKKLNLDPSEQKTIILSVKSPSISTRGPPVATIGVRAITSTGKDGTNNQTLIKTVTWSYNFEKINEQPGNYTSPSRIETTVDSAIVYELPNIIRVKHIDQSGGKYDGITFWRLVSVPVNVNIIISTDCIFEMGYIGSYDYENRSTIEDQEGNPIQDTVYLKGNVIKGTIYVAVNEREGSRGLKTHPLIEVISKEGNTSAESVGIIIPVIDTTGGIFSAGLSENKKVEVDVYKEFVDFEIKESLVEEPYLSVTIGPTQAGVPQGIMVDKFDDKVNVEVIDKYVVTVKGDVEVLTETATPPLIISPTEKMIFMDPENIKDINIKGNEKYDIEIKKYSKNDEVETITIEDVEPGGYETYWIGTDFIEITTTSPEEKTVLIIFEKDGKRFNIELPLVNTEKFEIKNFNLDERTATIIIYNKQGNVLITLENLPNDLDSEEFKEERRKAQEDDEDEDTDYVCILIFLLVLLLILLFTINYWYRKKGKRKDEKITEASKDEDFDFSKKYIDDREDKQKIEEDKEFVISEEEESSEVSITGGEVEGPEIYTSEETSFNKVNEKPMDDDEPEGESYNAYCFKCRASMKILEPEFSCTENGRYAAIGKCAHCASKVSRFLSACEIPDEINKHKDKTDLFTVDVSKKEETDHKKIDDILSKIGEIPKKTEKLKLELKDDEIEDVKRDFDFDKRMSSRPGKSYYKIIKGQKYDRELLETAYEMTNGKEDEEIDLKDAEKLWEDAQDNYRVTLTEIKTLEYILDNIKCSNSARDYLEKKIIKK